MLSTLAIAFQTKSAPSSVVFRHRQSLEQLLLTDKAWQKGARQESQNCNISRLW
jgi:hypothetical protein